MESLKTAEEEVESKLRRIEIRIRRARAVSQQMTVAARTLYEQELNKLAMLQTTFKEAQKAIREAHDLEGVDYATTESANGK